MIAEKNIYLNADKTKVVSEDSKDAAFLLVGKDCEIPRWAVEKFKLGSKTENEKSTAPAENKAVAPSSNKKAGKSGTKTNELSEK